MTIGKTTMATMRHRVVLCSMRDVVEKNGIMELTRTEVVETWARVRPFVTFGAKGAFISPAGYHILDPDYHQSHWIAIRFQHELNITAVAWIYEARRKGTPRWYKILGVIETEDNRWYEMAVHVHEQSDDVSKPRGDLSPVHSNVIL